VTGDGHDPVKVASRLGILHLPRQVLEDVHGAHVMPGNELLPEHAGMVITRCLREWACLLPLDLGFETTQRLLGWLTHEPAIISTTEVRCLVRQHGGEIRTAEAAEADDLLAHPEQLARAQAQLAPAVEPRRKAAWPAELSAAVEAALAEAEPPRPEKVTAADWERVLQARREEHAACDAASLRRLGPEIGPGAIRVSGDEVLVRQPKKRQFHELRTARVDTAAGTRYVSGTGDTFLRVLWVLLLLCGARTAAVTLLADGARWIREFVAERLEALPDFTFLLDWFHLAKRCRELTSMIGRDRAERKRLYRRVRKPLWEGEVAQALDRLEQYRPHAKNEERLEELIQYIESRREMLVNYRERRKHREYIGSGGIEKGNDVMIARRQKRRGMHWSLETADRLAALKTLYLNQGWDRYWGRREVLRLATL
jgi:Uncharacterised protein family (UPF0236)